MATLAPPPPSSPSAGGEGQACAGTLEAKVVILGTQGVGKTSLVMRHVGNTFTTHVSPTIGASFFSFSMMLREYKIKLQLWDTAGQERFRSMAPMYYRRANAAMIVYDVTRESTFEEAREWVKELESKVDTKLALCVVGNKCDLSDQREVPRDKGEKFAHQLGAMFTETSAATNTGVKEAFLKLAQAVVSLHQHNQLAGGVMDPSFSPLSSYTTQPQDRGLNINHPHLANGKDYTDHEPLRVKNGDAKDDSVFNRCCS